MKTRFINPVVLTGLFLFFLPTTLFCQPEIEVEPVVIDFGGVEIEETTSEIMTLSNTGDEQLVIEEIVIDSDFFSDEDFDDFGRHQTYQFEYTPCPHIILIREATWDGEWLSLDDEVGVFTPDGLCAGAVVVEEVGEMLGITACGDDGEGEEPNGFRAGEEFEFRYWDCYTDCEVIADIEFIQGPEVWLRNGFTMIELTAEGGCHRIPDGEVIIPPEESAEITIYFHPEEPRVYDAVLSIESNDPENEVVTVELSGYGGDSEPPRIFEPSEESEIIVYVVEEFDLELRLEADDPDHENDQLVWSVEDADDLPGEQGDAWDFHHNEDGSADFTWTVGEDMASEEPYHTVFRVTDPAEAFDEITMLIRVMGDPLPPPEEIPDQELLEDSDRIDLCDLGTFVAEGVPRIFTFDLFESPLQLCLEIDPMTNELSAFPEENFCTDETGLEVTIHTVASYVFFYQMDFRVIVHPLNDPPGEFNLLTPEDNFQTRRFEEVLHFSWDEASQNEYEVDDVYYRLVFGESMDSQDSLVIQPVDVNEYEITVQDLLMLLGDNNISPSLQLLWWITANDDSAETMATNAPFSLINLAVSGEDRTGIPDNFVLLPAFPNPFNAQVSIGFGLPAPGWVTLSLVNTRGQSIKSLSQIGWYSAGYQRIGFDLHCLPAGSYFLHLDYNGRMLTQPIVLIK